MFTDKTLLITGGTGSFGNAIIRRFLDSNISEIRVFSRDEKKQDDMRKAYNNSKLKFYLGDVRDINSVIEAMRGVDYVFHAAALKQVPSCEFYPMQAVQTNIIGADNVLNAAIDSQVQKVILLSTDKAVYPINAMGISKAMMEKVAVAKSKNLDDNKITICCTRYGNVMASRGSVIPLFINQMLNGKPITITNPKMTRFMMSLDEAVKLVLFAFMNGKSGDIFVQKAPAATIDLLAKVLLKMFGKNQDNLQVIGTRHGEKVFETLLTTEEMSMAEDLGNYYRIPADTRDLNYDKYVEVGKTIDAEAKGYTSHNTHRLTEQELLNILLSLNEIQSDINEHGVIG